MRRLWAAEIAQSRERIYLEKEMVTRHERIVRQISMAITSASEYEGVVFSELKFLSLQRSIDNFQSNSVLHSAADGSAERWQRQ